MSGMKCETVKLGRAGVGGEEAIRAQPCAGASLRRWPLTMLRKEPYTDRGPESSGRGDSTCEGPGEESRGGGMAGERAG